MFCTFVVHIKIKLKKMQDFVLILYKKCEITYDKLLTIHNTIVSSSRIKLKLAVK